MRWTALQIGWIFFRSSSSDTCAIHLVACQIHIVLPRNYALFGSEYCVAWCAEKGGSCHEKGRIKGPDHDDSVLVGSVHSTFCPRLLHLS